jgi:hypothetical protein
MSSVQFDRRSKARRGDPDRKGRRAEVRAPVRLPVSVETLDGTKRISLLEVSLNGARLEGAGLPPVGRGIVLLCGEVEAFGTIVWAAGDRRGMHFDEPLGVSDLVALRRVAATTGDSGMTPEEQQAAADWESGLAR